MSVIGMCAQFVSREVNMRKDLSQSLDQAASQEKTADLSASKTRLFEYARAGAIENPSPTQIGHFRFIRKLGEGGMGVVYAAQDELLGRSVAIKMIRHAGASPAARHRFRQEAKSLARINHPRICQIFEIHEEGEDLFLVLELLEGESLADRLRAGPIPLEEALQIAREILEALEALHAFNTIHRDLKPSNIFLTTRGVKLLDFGLAKLTSSDAGESSLIDTAETLPGSFLGTPWYAAPEQVDAGCAGPSSDLFAVGCVIYEMLAGRRPFEGDSVVDVLHKIKHDDPIALDHSIEVAAVYRVIAHALQKRPEDRYQSAKEMAQDLILATQHPDRVVETRNQVVKRFIALPFRILQTDEETAFLAYSLPDAIANSLTNIDSLIVRSSILGSRFDTSDLKSIAANAGVDVVLTGTLLRIGEKLQVRSQLVEVPSGVLIWSDSEQFYMTDLFQLQDRLARKIVHSLVGQLTERQREAFHRDVPANSIAYEDYLRANQILECRSTENAKRACDLYIRCLKEDPSFAPAWARLGRAYRILQKFGPASQRKEYDPDPAFRRAFALNPDLTIAHNLYTSIEADLGQSPRAMVRLLERAKNSRKDPELFAGLVQSCRYCGELRASLVAHQRARELDPLIHTSVPHTCFLLGDYQGTLDWTPPESGLYLDAAALVGLGREDEALRRLRGRAARPGGPQPIMQSLRAILEGDRTAALGELDELRSSGLRDPETSFYAARHWAHLGEVELATEVISDVLDQNFLCDFSLIEDPWLDPLRAHPRYTDLLEKAAERRRQVHGTFLDAGGELILPSDSLAVS